MITDLYFKVLRHKATIPASVGVASFAAGAVAGYILGRREASHAEVIEKEYTEEDLTPQMELPFDSHETTQDFFKRMVEAEIVPAPTITILDPGEQLVQDAVQDEPEVHNIFDTPDYGDWNKDLELAKRDRSRPYILHVEEFVNMEAGYDQTTLTYYEGDDILVDERDVPIYNKAEIVGELKFGHGSDDRNAVYIRNDQLKADYEVLLDHGFYEEEVLGMSVQENFAKGDLKHAHKFRPED